MNRLTCSLGLRKLLGCESYLNEPRSLCSQDKWWHYDIQGLWWPRYMVILVDLDGQDLWRSFVAKTCGNIKGLWLSSSILYHSPSHFILTVNIFNQMCLYALEVFLGEKSQFPCFIWYSHSLWQKPKIADIWDSRFFPFVKPILKDEVAFCLSYDDLYPGETQQFIRLLWA